MPATLVKSSTRAKLDPEVQRAKTQEDQRGKAEDGNGKCRQGKSLSGRQHTATGGADDEADKRKGPERGDEIRWLVVPEAMPGHWYPAEQEKG